MSEQQGTGSPVPEITAPPGQPCYREVCQNVGAEWYNSSTRELYCTSCANWINEWNRGLCERVPLADVSRKFDGSQSPIDICNACEFREMLPWSEAGYCAEDTAEVETLEELGYNLRDCDDELARLKNSERYRAAYNRHLAIIAERLAEAA